MKHWKHLPVPGLSNCRDLGGFATEHGMTRYGVEADFIDTADLEAVKAALKENTCCVYLETPANPN